MKTKAILCRRISTGETRVFSVAKDVAEYLGVSRQAVGHSLVYPDKTCRGCEIKYAPRFFVVRDQEDKYYLCTYNAEGKKFLKVNKDGFILEKLAKSYRDVTKSLLEEEPAPMGWRLAQEFGAL